MVFLPSLGTVWNVCCPVTALERHAVVGSSGAGFMVRHLKRTLVKVGTVSRILVETISLAFAEISWVDWKKNVIRMLITLHVFLLYKFILLVSPDLHACALRYVGWRVEKGQNISLD